MKQLLLTAALIASSTFASAAYDTTARDTRENRTSATAWACRMTFSGEAKGIKLIIGFYNYNAKGDLNCISASNERVSFPITVSMKAAPLSPTIAFSKMEMAGVAANISLLNTYPEALLGNYYVAQGSVAFIGGVGAITAVHADLPSVAVNLSLQLVKGGGINLGLNKMVVALDEERL